MEFIHPHRPRVSRETRLLLLIAAISLAALWVLARIRFPERPVTPNPVPPVLAQLAPASAFDDMTSTLAALGLRLAPALMAIEVRRGPGAESSDDIVPALRIRSDVAVAVVGDPNGAPEPIAAAGMSVLARDRASELAVLRVPAETVPPLTTWSPRRREAARFFVATAVAHEGVSLRPVFLGSLFSAVTPLWSEPIWTTPRGTDVEPGMFVFTLEGALTGLVVEHEGRAAIVPGEKLLGAADRLLQAAPQTPGHLGVAAAHLTADLALATGARAGVVVTWVDPAGPAAEHLVVTDVIETLNGEATATLDDWRARALRLGAGDVVLLGVRRSGESRQVSLTAASRPAPTGNPSLGLTMRAVRAIGVEVLRVDADSAAARAGIETGDVLTRIDDINAPTPARVTRVYAGAPAGRPLLVAITRRDAHHVLVLRKP